MLIVTADTYNIEVDTCNFKLIIQLGYKISMDNKQKTNAVFFLLLFLNFKQTVQTMGQGSLFPPQKAF